MKGRMTGRIAEAIRSCSRTVGRQSGRARQFSSSWENVSTMQHQADQIGGVAGLDPTGGTW